MTGNWSATRLVKEARPLLLPWCIALLASLAALGPGGEFEESVRMLCLCGSVALFAALPFGAEFQQRTFPLLLSQPLERSRLWAEKFVVLALGAGLIVLLDCRTWHWLGQLRFWDLTFLGAILLAMVTSSGFWISLTRSVPAGITCGIVGQLLLFGMVPVAVRILHARYPVQVAVLLGEYKPEILATLGLYALSYVWFGRRFWRGRLRALLLAVATTVAVVSIGLWLSGLTPNGNSNSGNLSFEFLFVVVTACSATFWTLTARSTIGGLVFCVGSQVLGALLLSIIIPKVAGPLALQQEGELGAIVVGFGSLLFAGLFLWLGWRKFARMELRDAVFGEGIELPGADVRGHWSLKWLVCRPHNPLLNLFRKELRLQKPLFLTAVVVSVCWLLTWAANHFWPEQGYRPFLEILPFFYAPVALLLAGCVSLGDEKTLGVAAWQLVLPTLARRLWTVKLLVASMTGLVLGFGLPAALHWLGIATEPTAQMSPGPQAETLIGLFMAAWLFILLSFWASTVVSNAVRAALTTIVALAAGAGCVALGMYAGQVLVVQELESGLLTWAMTHWQMSPDLLANNAIRVMWLALSVAAAAWVFLLLRQSLEQFRRAELRRRTFLKYVCVLAGMLIAGTFWALDFITSATHAWARPQSELAAALRRLPPKVFASDAKPQVVSLAELEATGILSDSTKIWLKGAVISLQPVVSGAEANESERAFQKRYGFDRNLWYLTIVFPGGWPYSFNVVAPTPPRQREGLGSS